MERRLIEATLEHFAGHRAKTAKALGIGLRTLSGKLRQYGYSPRERATSKEAAESAVPQSAESAGSGRLGRRVGSDRPVNRRQPEKTTHKTKSDNDLNPAATAVRKGSFLAGGPLRYAACMGKLRGPEKLGKTSEAMLSGLFQATTIPVLEQMVSFAQARHIVLAGNIANMDTPGYQAHDLLGRGVSKAR